MQPTQPQEELEAYDKHQRLLEDQLDGKTAELIGESRCHACVMVCCYMRRVLILCVRHGL
jgi:hypothetical protein